MTFNFRWIAGACIAGILLLAAIALHLVNQHESKANALEEEWLLRPVHKVSSAGSTRTLEVVPLINWHASSLEELRTEPGVAYLVKTDSETVLFDLGFNQAEETPSPLEHNMDILGVSLSEIDTVFLSHSHRDHVGGLVWEKAGSFSLGTEQVDLSGKRAIAPTPLKYPGITVEHFTEAGYFAPGLATTGPIARQLFAGHIDEQALVINVEGLGLVVIVGCGHQTVEKLLLRIEESFDEPLYGIIGDLHYPVPEGRLFIAGIDAQRRFASGDGPFDPLTIEEVRRDMQLLEDQGLGLIALGGHDTSDQVLREFETNFDGIFRKVRVGEQITISSNQLPPPQPAG